MEYMILYRQLINNATTYKDIKKEVLIMKLQWTENNGEIKSVDFATITDLDALLDELEKMGCNNFKIVR
jgi:hypothetical protein